MPPDGGGMEIIMDNEDYCIIPKEDEEFISIVIKRLEENFGVSLSNIFKENNDASVIRNEMHKVIHSYIKNKNADCLDIKEIQQFTTAMEDGDEFNVIPPIGVTEENFNTLRSYKDGQIHDYVKRVTNGLSLIKDGMTDAEVASTILTSGIATVGVAMAIATIKALKMGLKLLPALIKGIRAIKGVTTVITVVSIIITELLIYLIYGNKKAFLGMFFNDTDLYLKVNDWRKGVDGGNDSDLYMNTGNVVGFMETNKDEQLTSPLVQIPARLFIEPNDPDNIVYGGIFVAEKSLGFYGTEGIMRLTPDTDLSLDFYFLFACPYLKSNGINVCIGNGDGKPKDIFQEQYDQRSLEKEFTLDEYTIHASCNSKTGGEAAGFAFLSKI